jgi:hydroxymethylpyrimidine/phosphomethylpyrimidine kinase
MPTNNAATHAPLLLSIAGHDPSGAAGIQADIETFAALGGRGASLITALTTQNTGEFIAIHPQPVPQFIDQADALFRDLWFSAAKIGLLGSAEIAAAVATLLPRLAGIPVVLDPVTHSGTGRALADRKVRDIITRDLLPMVTILTPNTREACELAGTDHPDTAVRRLLELGARCLLVTSGDQDGATVVNRLFRPAAETLHFEYPRLPGQFHGSGCTLSAAIAALLGLGSDLEAAVRRAQDYTWKSLQRAVRLGRGQWHPTRLAGAPPE